MAEVDIAAVTSQVFALLEPRAKEERQRIVRAAFALLGDDLPSAPTGLVGRAVGAGSSRASEDGGGTASLGPRASSWVRQHKLAQADLEQVFYFHDGRVDIHVNDAVGASKREQTVNCYLLVGLKAFLESDSPAFTDADAMALCKHTQAYDKNNHPKFRHALGNFVNGSKDGGFELAGPGLKAAGDLLAGMRDAASE